MIRIRIVSSLEKALLDDKIERFTALERISALRGERLSFQILSTFEILPGEQINIPFAKVSIKSELAKHICLREVGNVPIERPTLDACPEDNDYISKKPGLYPDILRPLRGGDTACPIPYYLSSVWADMTIPSDLDSGEYDITVIFDCGDRGYAEASLKIEIIGASLPSEDIHFTQWFHCDSLAHYYNVEVWSERHWEIIENFARVATRNGINMMLTPVFTPPLDTAIGGERLTTQLIGVKKDKGQYSFDFTLLDRWIDMCNRVGIKNFEISHFFTQWGAEHAPKVMATVDGEYKKIFGWDTAAAGPEYSEFLRTFLKEFIAHMKARGDDKRCYYHISDEPRFEHLDNYKAARNVIADLIKGYPIMDAISNYEFWQLGLMDIAIPASDHINPFIKGEVPALWTYYCCSQSTGVSNRFISMHSWRNRSIGVQMYKYDIVGFLHWGYNFYQNIYSVDPINPYLIQDGNGWVPAGDAFSVYPDQNGDALESIRIVVFNEALQDIKAMKLCEKYYGKETIIKLIDETFGTDVTFTTCAKSAKPILLFREKINEMIKAKL